MCGVEMLGALDSERTPGRLPATPLDEGVSPWRRGRCHWLAPPAGAIKPGPEHRALTASARLGRCRPRSGKGRISARPSVTPWRTTSECGARGPDALPSGRAVAETWELSGLGPGKERARRGGRGEAWRGARRRTRGSGTLGRAGGRARESSCPAPGAGRNRLAQCRRLLSGTGASVCAGMLVEKQVQPWPLHNTTLHSRGPGNQNITLLC